MELHALTLAARSYALYRYDLIHTGLHGSKIENVYVTLIVATFMLALSNYKTSSRLPFRSSFFAGLSVNVCLM